MTLQDGFMAKLRVQFGHSQVRTAGGVVGALGVWLMRTIDVTRWQGQFDEARAVDGARGLHVSAAWGMERLNGHGKCTSSREVRGARGGAGARVYSPDLGSADSGQGANERAGRASA